MTYQDLVTEIEGLPLAEQMSLMETLFRLVSRTAGSPIDHAGSLQRVRGLLKPGPNELMPTDAELDNKYTDYLIRKYA